MKCHAAFTLALAAFTVAKPMPAKRQGNATVDDLAQQVASSINSWLQDIQNVNTFVDTAGGLTSAQDISNAAATAFVSAQDEGTQNNNLAQLTTLDASGNAANIDLANQFNIIGPAINDTASNPQNLQMNLAKINGARCPGPVGNGAIFEEGEVQQSAALAAGVTAPLPQLPAACGILAQQLVSS
ncbi:unnamed protein product [Discula destructiva]